MKPPCSLDNRVQDLVKVRGWQVSPTEIEATLLTHPQVAGACVIRVPSPDGTGEVPRAYVVRKPTAGTEATASNGIDGETQVEEEDIKAYMAARLAKYKALDGGVVFVDEIPRTVSGKAMKFKLQEMVKAAE